MKYLDIRKEIQMLMLVILALNLTGCITSVMDYEKGKDANVKCEPLPPVWGKLLPENEAIPVDFSQTIIEGNLSPDDRHKLSRLIGRMTKMNKEVVAIKTFADDIVVSAKLTFHGWEVYCIKDKAGIWDISKLVKVTY
jgi:hypothetical protein